MLLLLAGVEQYRADFVVDRECSDAISGRCGDVTKNAAVLRMVVAVVRATDIQRGDIRLFRIRKRLTRNILGSCEKK